MVTATYWKKIIKMTHVWFATPSELNSMRLKNGGCISYIHGVDFVPQKNAFILGEQKTVIKDLSPDIESIFSSLGKHLKQYIKRSLTENLVQNIIYTSSTIKSNIYILEICAQLYEKMFQDKGQKASFNKELALAYIEHQSLLLEFLTIKAYQSDLVQ